MEEVRQNQIDNNENNDNKKDKDYDEEEESVCTTIIVNHNQENQTNQNCQDKNEETREKLENGKISIVVNNNKKSDIVISSSNKDEGEQILSIKNLPTTSNINCDSKLNNVDEIIEIDLNVNDNSNSTLNNNNNNNNDINMFSTSVNSIENNNHQNNINSLNAKSENFSSRNFINKFRNNNNNNNETGGRFYVIVSERVRDYFDSLNKSKSSYERTRSYQFFKSIRTELVASILFSLIISQTLIICRSSMLNNYNDLKLSEEKNAIYFSQQQQQQHNSKSDKISKQIRIDDGSDNSLISDYILYNNNSTTNSNAKLVNNFIFAFISSIIVATLTQVFGHISGCHLIPSISIALYIKGHISRFRLASYLFAQLFGSLFGILLLILLTSSQVNNNRRQTTIKKVNAFEMTKVGNNQFLLRDENQDQSFTSTMLLLTKREQQEYNNSIISKRNGNRRRKRENQSSLSKRDEIDINLNNNNNTGIKEQVNNVFEDAGENVLHLDEIDKNSETILLSIMEQQQQQQQRKRRRRLERKENKIGNLEQETPDSSFLKGTQKNEEEEGEEAPKLESLKLKSIIKTNISNIITDSENAKNTNNNPKTLSAFALNSNATAATSITPLTDSYIDRKILVSTYQVGDDSGVKVKNNSGRVNSSPLEMQQQKQQSNHHHYDHDSSKNLTDDNRNDSSYYPLNSTIKLKNNTRKFGEKVEEEEEEGKLSNETLLVLSPTNSSSSADKEIETNKKEERLSETRSLKAFNDTSSLSSLISLAEQERLQWNKESLLFEENNKITKASLILPEGQLEEGGKDNKDNRMENKRKRRVKIKNSRLRRGQPTNSSINNTNSSLSLSLQSEKKIDNETSLVDNNNWPINSNSNSNNNNNNNDHHDRFINLLELSLPDIIMSSESMKNCIDNEEKLTIIDNNYQKKHDERSIEKGERILNNCLLLTNSSQMFLFQLIATLIIILTYLINVDPRRVDLGFKSLSIGFSYFIASIITINSGGFYGNPFQLIFLNLFASTGSGWRSEWFIYLITPIIGGLFGAFSHEYIDFTSLRNRNKQLHLRRSFYSLENLANNNNSSSKTTKNNNNINNDDYNDCCYEISSSLNNNENKEVRRESNGSSLTQCASSNLTLTNNNNNNNRGERQLNEQFQLNYVDNNNNNNNNHLIEKDEGAKFIFHNDDLANSVGKVFDGEESCCNNRKLSNKKENSNYCSYMRQIRIEQQKILMEQKAVALGEDEEEEENGDEAIKLAAIYSNGKLNCNNNDNNTKALKNKKHIKMLENKRRKKINNLNGHLNGEQELITREFDFNTNFLIGSNNPQQQQQYHSNELEKHHQQQQLQQYKHLNYTNTRQQYYRPQRICINNNNERFNTTSIGLM